MSDLEIEKLIARLDDTDIFVQLDARDMLVTMPDKAIPPAIKLLEYGTPRQIANAIIIIGDVGDTSTASYLLPFLSDKDLMIRINAARAIGEVGNRDMIPMILDALAVEEDATTATWLVTSLGRLKGYDEILAILENSEGSYVCYTAIKALGEIGNPAAIEYILPFLDDENRHVRDHALIALKKLGYAFND